MRYRFLFLCAALCVVLAFAQTTLTNDSIIKMAKAGLGEDVILNAMKAQPAAFSVGVDDLITLKGAGVSDKVISAMMAKMSAQPAASGATMAPAPAGASVPAPGGGPLVPEVGVYVRKNDAWAEVPPEIVNFKTGGVLKTIGTAGIVKRDVNGHVNGEHSRNQLKPPISLLVYTPEGVAITEYQLLRLHEQKDSREFRTVTGGVLHSSGGATRDYLEFESKKLQPRTYEIVLPTLGSGEYGLLPPLVDASGSGRVGKIFSFRIVE